MSYVTIIPELVSLNYANDEFFCDEMSDGAYLIGFFLPNGLFYIHDAVFNIVKAQDAVARLNGGSRG